MPESTTFLRAQPYRPPAWLRNAHAQTVFAAALRRVRPPRYHRERVELRDGDFVDVDFVEEKAPRIAILCHGLESSSREPYIYGMCHALARRGWDLAVMNMRGCGGEANRLLRAYHSGESDDLEEVVAYVETSRNYEHIGLIGFSLGGNIVLKYAGERGGALQGRIAAAAAVSAPCDLAAGARKLEEAGNEFYLWRFIRRLKRKALLREKQFPGAVDYDAIRAAQTFTEFDELFTAPVNGFESARDYWARASAKRVANGIAIPALLLNAADDPFLKPSCHMKEIAGNHPFFTSITTQAGGHVAFVQSGPAQEYYHESLVADFISTAAQ